MSRRMSLFLATALLAAQFVYAEKGPSDRDCTREKASPDELQVQVSAPAPVTLAELFATPVNDASIEMEDGVSAIMTQREVVIARIGVDGKPVMACVDDPAAAKRFFKAPVERLSPKQAQEQ